MDSNWPDGWTTATLEAAGLPVTDFTRKVMTAWAASTPMLAYTNNPLGMPAVKGKTLELLRTGYAMFATPDMFRQAFAEFIGSHGGQAVHQAMSLDEKFSEVWRAVHALPWPANKTETDWPSAVLDLTSESYRRQAQTVSDPADRKTSGAYGSQTASGTLSSVSSRVSAQTMIAIQQATAAVQGIPGRMR